MAKYFISLGSNTQQSNIAVESAMKWFPEFATIIARTPVYQTPDIHDASRMPYSNAIAAIECNIPADKLNRMLKEYETKHGRVSGSPTVIIDLDLVSMDNTILRQRDYSAPYFLEGLYLLSTVKAEGGILNK